MPKKVKLWFVMTPNNHLDQWRTGIVFCGKTRASAWLSAAREYRAWDETESQAILALKEQGYTCRRLEVEVPDGK